MSVLDAPPQKPPRNIGPYGLAVCPECMGEFILRHPRQMFCCEKHKRAWHNRAVVRGARLAPLVMAMRITRGGSRGNAQAGKDARRAMEKLVGEFDREDRGAKRMRAPDYVALRNRLGYET